MLKFLQVSYRNLLSVGNTPITIQLDEPGSYLIIGRNGAGKSLLGEAITYALYGKPYRKINKPQLVNSINKREMLVELDFNAHGKIYRIRRGMKPTVFEVFENGKLLNQPGDSRDYQEELEKKILKMNFRAFKQIVMLGTTAYVPFMELNPAQRREMIEDLLNLSTYTAMLKLNAKNVQAARDRLQELQIRIETTQEKIDLIQANIARFLQNTEDLVNAKQAKLEESSKEQEDAIDLIQQLSDKISELQATYDKLSTQANQTWETATRVRNKILDRQKLLGRELEFFKHTNNCPTCAQGIDENYRDKSVHVRLNTLNELQAALEQADSRLQWISGQRESNSNLKKQLDKKQFALTEARSNIRVLQSTINNLISEIEALHQQKNTLSVDENQIKDFRSQLKAFIKDKRDTLSQAEVYKAAVFLLKDSGIKAQIIKQYVPIMNKLINKYLASMDFFVQFELDENFNEVIKSRFRDDFTYPSFSEGEKFRIDLSILMCWRAIARLKNSCITNLLFLDEIFDSSLDQSGIDDFMKLLDTLVTEGTTVMVVSHKGDQLVDKFESVLRFDKVRNFTQLVEP